MEVFFVHVITDDEWLDPMQQSLVSREAYIPLCVTSKKARKERANDEKNTLMCIPMHINCEKFL